MSYQSIFLSCTMVPWGWSSFHVGIMGCILAMVGWDKVSDFTATVCSPEGLLSSMACFYACIIKKSHHAFKLSCSSCAFIERNVIGLGTMSALGYPMKLILYSNEYGIIVMGVHRSWEVPRIFGEGKNNVVCVCVCACERNLCMKLFPVCGNYRS